MNQEDSQIIEGLSPFLTEGRKKSIARVLSKRLNNLRIAIESPSDIHNAMAIVRSADAFGVQQVDLIAARYKKGRGKQTARGTLPWIDFKKHRTFKCFKAEIKSGGFKIAGAVIEGEFSIDTIPIDAPICLLLGNEHAGLSQEALAGCDFTYSIPMYGAVESLNLSVAGALSLYELSKKIRRELDREGNLSEEELLNWTARHYVRTVGKEKARLILARKSHVSEIAT